MLQRLDYKPSLKQRGGHGGFFHYVTAVTEALAWVMERASGKACDQLLQDIWGQLGYERDDYFMADPWGRSGAGAGLAPPCVTWRVSVACWPLHVSGRLSQHKEHSHRHPPKRKYLSTDSARLQRRALHRPD